MAKAKKVSNLSTDEILWAHKMLQASGMTDEIKQKVGAIYKQIFGEELQIRCCKNKAYIKLDYYVRHELKTQEDGK